MGAINKGNVGRIAERIVSNELEYRGFRVSDLNKEGTAANADLLAAKDGRTWQIQVKGSTEDGGWWFGYGYCTHAVIARDKPMFNRANNFYAAKVVVLACVKVVSRILCKSLFSGFVPFFDIKFVLPNLLTKSRSAVGAEVFSSAGATR